LHIFAEFLKLLKGSQAKINLQTLRKIRGQNGAFVRPLTVLVVYSTKRPHYMESNFAILHTKPVAVDTVLR